MSSQPGCDGPAQTVSADCVEVDDGWSGTRVVRMRRAAPGAVRIVDDAVPAELARQIYEHTIQEGRSWGTYVTLEAALSASPLADTAAASTPADVAARASLQLPGIDWQVDLYL